MVLGTERRPGRVQRIMEDFRGHLLAQDAAEMAIMAQRWRAVEAALEGQIEALIREAELLRSKGQPVTRSTLYALERYRNLLGQARVEVLKYDRWAAEQIGTRQGELGKAGIRQAQLLIRESYLEAGQVPARFNLLPAEAAEAMIGRASNGSPLYELLIDGYADSIDMLTGALVEGTAKGINPRQTARLMERAMEGNLQRALVIARTEQLRAYRSAAKLQMKESGVVEGWIWRCALQSTTCLACLAMDGTVHDIDEELDDHPNGRCFQQPKIIGLAPVEGVSGSAWFADQEEEVQRAMMGEARFEAWSEGRLDFGALAGRAESAEWGSHVHEASLEELGV